MATLEITRVLDSRFEFELNGDGNILSSDQNRLFTDNGLCNFKTGTGASIVGQQNISYSDVTVIDTYGGTGPHVFANVVQLWNKLIELNFFEGVGGGGGGGAPTTFASLTDTPSSYSGEDGKVPVVNESQQELEFTTFYNINELTQLSDVEIDTLVIDKILGIELVDGIKKVVLIDKPADGENYFSAVGGFDYNDLDTATTPISFTGTEVKLTNDTLGSSTYLASPPYGITGVWNVATDSFDFSQLSEGDEVVLRVDIDHTTTSANQVSQLYLKFTDDVTGAFQVKIDTSIENKSSGTHNITRVISFYVRDDWKNNAVDLYYYSDANADIQVNGWHPFIVRKSINILDVTGYNPIEIYADLSALIADQSNQNISTIYEITDASGITDVVSGRAWVRYSGATVGDETDYIIVSKEEFLDVSSEIAEEKVIGTAVYNATLTGAESIDLDTFSSLRGILTGNTTITFSNTPAEGETFTKTMLLTGNYTLSFADADYEDGSYDGTATMNIITIELSNFTTAGLLVSVDYKNIA